MLAKVESHNGFTTLDGRFFPFNTGAERVEAAAQANAHTAAIIARREKLAGRALTDKEHAHGLGNRVDDRDRLAQLDEHMWRVVPVKQAEPESTGNPIRDYTAVRAANYKTSVDSPPEADAASRAAFEERIARRFDPKPAPDPLAVAQELERRLAYKRQASDLYEATNFDPLSTLSVVQFARQAKEQIDADGDLDEFRRLYQASAQRYILLREQHAMELAAKAAQAKAEYRNFALSDPLEPTE